MLISEKQRKAFKQTYEFYKSRGYCVRCKKNQAMLDRILCDECAEKQAERDIARRRTKKFKEFNREMSKINYQKRKEAGKCGRCGKRKPIPGKLKCLDCTLKCKKYDRGRKLHPVPHSDRVTRGLCYFCAEPVLSGKKTCKKHYEQKKYILAKNTYSCYNNNADNDCRALSALLSVIRKRIGSASGFFFTIKGDNMKAYIEINMPETCAKCLLKARRNNDYCCILANMRSLSEINGNIEREPFCPLKAKELCDKEFQ